MGPAYFAGAELFGAIYFAFGKQGVFAAMEDPRKLFDLYNRAIDKEPRLLSGCPRIPTKTVERALADRQIVELGFGGSGAFLHDDGRRSSR